MCQIPNLDYWAPLAEGQAANARERHRSLSAVIGTVSGMLSSGSTRVSTDAPDDPDMDHAEYTLGDLEALGAENFNIWVDGAETAWAAYMWSVLARKGLTSYTDEAGRALVVCRLIALAGINREFAARACGEGEVGGWQNSMFADVVGDYPRLDPIALGRAAERLGASGYTPYDERESAAELVLNIAASEWQRVVRALSEELGSAELFATLWTNRESHTQYPLADEVLWAAVNDDPSGAKVDGYQWVDDGCDWLV